MGGAQGQISLFLLLGVSCPFNASVIEQGGARYVNPWAMVIA